MAHSSESINFALGSLEILHGRFGNELCDMLKHRTGNMVMYDEIVNHNNLMGWIIEILYDYIPVGNSTINDATNTLTEAEITSLINFGYRIMNKYGSKIHTPTNSNIYL